MAVRNRSSKLPALREAIVCYADILGFRDQTRHAFAKGEESDFLRRVKRSLRKAYKEVNRTATAWGTGPPIFKVKIFTDNFLLAYPLTNLERDGETELGVFLMLVAQVQASLAAEGFFLRGAIAAGQHYQVGDIVYGDALLDAVDLDKSGGPPRVVIAPSLGLGIAKHLTYYGDVRCSPHYTYLLEDARDRHLFVNYLEVPFEFFSQGWIDWPLLTAFKDSLCSGLRDNASSLGVRQKYEWTATYHNYICRTFASQCPIGSPDKQGILGHLVSFETLPSELPPRRLV